MEVYFKDLKEWPDHFLDASQRTEFNPLRPLIKAILDDNNELSKDLITQGSDLNIADNEGRTALMSAAYKSNKEITQILLDAGAKVNQSDNHKHSALFYAAVQNNEEIVQLLIEKGSDINVTDRYGNTPLFTAAANTVKEIALLFIVKGANVNAFNILGETPLFYAAQNPNKYVPRLLVEKGAEVNISDHHCGRTPLISAALNVSEEEIPRLLIEKGADVNVSDRYGKTPLLFASSNKNKEVSRLLIEKGADVNASDHEGTTPIMSAAENNNEEAVRLLIEKGANVKAKNVCRQTPLLLAAGNLSEEVIRLLIEKGADINASDQAGITPLMLAAEHNTLEVTRLLINEYTDVNKCSTFGSNPLSFAASNVIKDVSRLLIEKGVNVNVANENGYTPLFLAAENQNEEVAQMLIEKGANINVSDRYGKTPLFFASSNKNKEVSRLLIEKGADVNATDETGKTPLFLAAKNTNEEVARQLIEKGADVNVSDEKQQTPLFVAAENNNEEIPRLLIEKGADVNVSDRYGKTPLFFASSNKNKEVSRLLIEKGADVNASNYNGTTPIMFAAENNNEEAVRLLIEKGADVNATDKQGKTPLYFAAIRGNEQVALLLIDKGADINISDVYGQTHSFLSKKGYEMLRLLIEKGVDVNKSDQNGRTPLSVAVQNDNEGLARLLIEKGADVNLSYKHQQWPLLIPAKKNNHELARLLIEKGTDVNALGGSLFRIAIEHSSDEVAQLLLKSGADIDIVDNHGRTALFYLVGLLYKETKHHPRSIFASPTVAVDLNPLDSGIEHKELSGLRKKLTRQVATACKNIDFRDHDGRTALSYAIDNMYRRQWLEPLARILIEEGANVNTEDNNGQTPLFYALMPSAVRLLLDNGANLDVRNNEQETVLMHVIKRISKEQDIQRYDLNLLFNSFEAIVKARDLYGRTAMFYAVMECNTIEVFQSIASNLIENGAVLNDTDNIGVSVLSYYIEKYFCNEFELKDENDASKGITFFTENGILKSTVFISALSYLHVILPNLLLSNHRLPYEPLEKYNQSRNAKLCPQVQNILNLVEVASQPASHQQLLLIKNLKKLLEKNKILEALDVLIQLGVNPNSSDRHGNTALHYATLLPFQVGSHECVMKIFQTLEKHGVRFNVKNQEKETPLHFCLSDRAWKSSSNSYYPRRFEFTTVIADICGALLKDVSLISETTRSGESVYHLIMKMLQKKLYGCGRLWGDQKATVFEDIINLLELFSKATEKSSNVLRKMDNRQNSPLHLWASLSLSPKQSYEYHVTKPFTFETLLDTILKHLLSHGASPNPRNEEDRTPLHECKTWTAIELLINAGADRNALDRKRRSPLLNVAKQAKLKQGGYDSYIFRERFLPDAKKDKEFFEKCVTLGLDIWSSDNEGESLLSIFLELQDYEMAKALIDATVANTDSTSVIKQLVDTICKDEKTNTTWKSLLTKTLISSSAIPSKINLDEALRHICTNIEKLLQSDGFEDERESDEDTDMKDSEEHSALKSNVYVDIARQLLFYGADGHSLCDDFPKLRPFLTTAISLDQVEKIIPWTSRSKKHKDKLESVSRKQEVEKICNYYFHKEPIGHGSFGEVYAGICEKDAREVAIKKIKKSLVNRPQDEREIINLTALADSQQVVTYIFFEDSDKDFVYIVLELMEGHLDDYLAVYPINASEFTKLCQCIVKGLTYLHEYQPTPILHRDLKPENILYNFDTQGKVQLKIADFGLSTPLLPSRTTVLDSKAGTRCWTAPEVIRSQSHQHSKSSDVFSCGLLFHYILSQQNHPFSPADCTGKTREVIDHETQGNMLNNKMDGWDDSLSLEAKHLINDMLHKDNTQRPSAADTLRHPFFWSDEKKMKLLTAVGNQPEIGTRRPACGPLNALESDLENEQRTIIKYGDWNDAKYTHASAIYTHMQSGPHARRNCDTRSVVELVRFVRNSVSHVSESGRPIHMQQQILDGVFLKEFPALLMEVYKAVNKHGWNSREEIRKL